jgi:hypothetical protein
MAGKKIPVRRYSPRQAMLYEPCKCDTMNRPPMWMLDDLADEALTGGYNTQKSNICDIHFLARSANGTCQGCEGGE